LLDFFGLIIGLLGSTKRFTPISACNPGKEKIQVKLPPLKIKHFSPNTVMQLVDVLNLQIYNESPMDRGISKTKSSSKE
jgi:hypothetical protein